MLCQLAAVIRCFRYRPSKQADLAKTELFYLVVWIAGVACVEVHGRIGQDANPELSDCNMKAHLPQAY
jgi:hypothetical protein